MKRLLPLNLQFFAEETSAETENTDTQQQQQPQKEEVRTIPYERFKQVNDDLRTFKETFKTLGLDGIDSLKALVEDYNAKKQAEEERQRAEMTEIERLQADLKAKEEAEQALAEQLAQAQAAAKQERIRNAFITAAQSAGIAYIDDAYRLADLSTVTVGEDGTVSGVSEVVASLVESKPFLLKQKTQPNPIGDSTNSGNTGGKTAEQLLAEAAAKAKASGKLEDQAAYAKLKRELML